MKTKLLFTLLLITISGFCIAQAQKKGQVPYTNGKTATWISADSLIFSAYERAEFAEYENILRQIVKVYQQQDSAKNIFLRKFLVYNGIDLRRISEHPDSLKITSKGIQFILKPKTK